MKVKILKKNPNTRIPAKAHQDDFCYDVWAVSEEEIAPNVWKYGLGFAIEIDREGSVPPELDLCVDLRPRSSVWEHGMVLSNSEATIDEGYRGELSMVFFHVFPNMPRYVVGDKIGQLKIGAALSIDWKEVDVLSPSIRGANGYGSTGKR